MSPLMIQYVEDSVRFMHYVDDVPDAVLDSLDLTWLRMTPDDRSAASKLLYQIKLMVDGDDVDHDDLVKDLESSGCHKALKLVQSIIPMTRTTRASTREVTLTRYQAEGILSRDVKRAKNPLVKGGLLSVDGENLIFTLLGMRVYAELNRRRSLPAREVFITVRLVDEDTLAASLDDTLRVSVVGPNEVAFFWGKSEMVRWKTWSEEPVQDCARAMCIGALRFPFEMFSSEVQTQWPALALAVAEYVEKMPLLPGPRKDFLVKFAEGVRASSPQASLPVGGVA